MKSTTAVVVGVTAAVLAAAPALADAGTPGTTFPEQPESNPQMGCEALLANAAALSAPRSQTAFAITNALFDDACFGG